MFALRPWACTPNAEWHPHGLCHFKRRSKLGTLLPFTQHHRADFAHHPAARMSPPSFIHYQVLSFIFLASLGRVAYGHGFVHAVVIGDASYPGWNPFVDPYASPVPSRIVRNIPNDGYISIPDPDIACHHGGNNGTSAVATVAAGSQVNFQWAYWPGDHQGPVSTYMTSCGGDCATFQADDALWFKVDAEGYDADNQQWAAAKLIANNSTWTSVIPSDLAPGQYLMRNEIVALQSATPQFYPSCSQIEVTGSGTGVPSDGELVSMQTLYQGVTFPDIYGDSVSFTIPGPPPVSFGGSSGNTTGPIDTSSSSASQGTSAAVPGPSQSSPNRCRVTSTRRLQRRRVSPV